MSLRGIYVTGMHGLREGLRKTGTLGWLERRQGRPARWLRSLFAI